MNLPQLIERLKQIEQEAINKGLDCSKIEVSLNAGEYSCNQARLEEWPSAWYVDLF